MLVRSSVIISNDIAVPVKGESKKKTHCSTMLFSWTRTKTRTI